MIIPLFHNYHKETDEALMLLILKKDEHAFNELFSRYSRRLQGFFWRRSGGDEEETADLTQDLFLRVWEKAAKYNSEQPVETWLFAIAYNILTDHYRHVGYQALYVEHVQQTTTESVDEDISVNLEKKDFDKALNEVLKSFSEAEQLLFDLRFTQELSVADIARIIQIPEGTVKSRLHALTNKLRNKLKHYEQI